MSKKPDARDTLDDRAGAIRAMRSATRASADPARARLAARGLLPLACLAGGLALAGLASSAALGQRDPRAGAPADERGARPAPLTGKDRRTAAQRPPPVTGYLEPGESRWFASLMEFPDPDGSLAVAYTGAPFDTATNPFFQKQANGRACVTCHQPADAMSLSTATIQKRWAQTGGRDPMFNASDGSNCPNLPPADPKSHSLLLNRGLFRIALPWPPKRPDGSAIDPEFTIEVVADPTGCNTSPIYGLKSSNPKVSVFRRPRPAANLRYIEAVPQDFNSKTGTPLEIDPVTHAHSNMSIMSDARVTSVHGQAMDAASIHMGAKMASARIDEIVEFQRKLYVAQESSKLGGRFDAPNTPKALGVKAMITGTEAFNGNDRDTGVFYLFDEWKNSRHHDDKTAEFRASVARGYDVFFLKPLWIRDTYGINHTLLGNPYKQTCAFCHNTQLTGQDDNPGWIDIGKNNFPYSPPAPELPTFKIVCKPTAAPHPYLGREIYTHDPGRALISGKCTDVGALVMQQFRGMAARAPYFNNGSAKSLREVVDFYDRRYSIGYTDQEKEDLINFLSTL